MDAQYIGNLRHSQAEPVATATTAPSVKLRKEGDNVSLPSSLMLMWLLIILLRRLPL